MQEIYNPEMAAPRVCVAAFLILAIAVSATWGACEYTCIIGDKDDGYGGCQLKMTYDDAKTKCMDCWNFCKEYGEEESITLNGGSIVSARASMMMPIIIMTAVNSK